MDGEDLALVLAAELAGEGDGLQARVGAVDRDEDGARAN